MASCWAAIERLSVTTLQLREPGLVVDTSRL